MFLVALVSGLSYVTKIEMQENSIMEENAFQISGLKDEYESSIAEIKRNLVDFAYLAAHSVVDNDFDKLVKIASHKQSNYGYVEAFFHQQLEPLIQTLVWMQTLTPVL
ncbi:MAG: hypothetical protein R3Y10_08930 [Ferrimonas sp.]